jgi:hypothetical protein
MDDISDDWGMGAEDKSFEKPPPQQPRGRRGEEPKLEQKKQKE